MNAQQPPFHHDSVPASGLTRIGIVGGGPGGLMTAYLLQKKLAVPVEITIFESSNRFGGKIQTLEFDSAKVKYEAGAAEFYDYSGIDHDSLKDLIQELGLMIAPMGGNSVVLDDRILGTLDDIEWNFGRASRRELERFYWKARSLVSTAEFYDSQGEEAPPLIEPERGFDELLGEIQVPATHRYVERLIHSDLATSPAQTNITYGLHNFLMNDADYMQLYGIVGGNEQLVEALQGLVSAQLCLNALATKIYRLQSGEIRVDYERTAGAKRAPEQQPSYSEELKNLSDLLTTVEGVDSSSDLDSEKNRVAGVFDQVIVALPLDQLKKVEFGGTVLNSAVSEHIERFDFPAHYLRVTILFERPFWQGVLADSFCMLEAFGGCCLYDESSRTLESQYGVLGWLVAGEVAEKYAECSDDKLIEMALDSLPSMFSGAEKLVLEGKVHRWIGAVNGMPGGRTSCALDRRHQPEPLLHSNLFFVGDYLFDSTINGVLDSADYVSDWIAANLNFSTR